MVIYKIDDMISAWFDGRVLIMVRKIILGPSVLWTYMPRKVLEFSHKNLQETSVILQACRRSTINHIL